MIFVAREHYPSQAEEKAQYDRHENSPDDPRYRRFLSRLFIPLSACLAKPGRGLDFGSGPGPTLSVMFEEAGHTVNIYDPFYAPDRSVLEGQYDFVTATEVVEHLHNPGRTLNQLWRCVKPGGYLGIMTKLTLGQEAFARWHYKNESTHVCFFSKVTFQWLASLWKAQLKFVDKDALIFQKMISNVKGQA